MVGISLVLAQAKEYHPGFQDLNLFVVAICLIVFLYAILIAAIGFRVLSARGKLREIDQLLERAKDTPQLAKSLSELQLEREEIAAEFSRMTSSAPGRWFAGPKQDSVTDSGEPT